MFNQLPDEFHVEFNKVFSGEWKGIDRSLLEDFETLYIGVSEFVKNLDKDEAYALFTNEQKEKIKLLIKSVIAGLILNHTANVPGGPLYRDPYFGTGKANKADAKTTRSLH